MNQFWLYAALVAGIVSYLLGLRIGCWCHCCRAERKRAKEHSRRTFSGYPYDKVKCMCHSCQKFRGEI